MRSEHCSRSLTDQVTEGGRSPANFPSIFSTSISVFPLIQFQTRRSVWSYHDSCAPLKPLDPPSHTTALPTNLTHLTDSADLTLERFLIFAAVIGTDGVGSARVEGSVGCGADVEVGERIEFDGQWIGRIAFSCGFDLFGLQNYVLACPSILTLVNVVM